MTGAFFGWLDSVDRVVADFFRRNGIPEHSNRLDKLLRTCSDSYVRYEVKKWHRKYRAHLKTLYVQLSPEMIKEMQESLIVCYVFDPPLSTRGSYSIATDYLVPGSNEIGSFEVLPNGTMRDMFPEILQGVISEARWLRVMQRWQVKHKPCSECDGSGILYEVHDFYQEALACYHCMGSGRA